MINVEAHAAHRRDGKRNNTKITTSDKIKEERGYWEIKQSVAAGCCKRLFGDVIFSL